MKNKYDNIQCVFKNNLTRKELMDDLKGGCEAIGVDHIEVKVIPFSDELPTFPKDKKSIFYGSTTMMYNVYRDSNLNEGLFFDEETFTMEKYFSFWGVHMLNYDAGLTSFRELMKKNYEPEQLLFIRPNDDSKSFAGEVVEFSRIEIWYNNLIGYENVKLDLDTKIVAGEPYNIKKEWRLWIVNKKVIASSQYKDGQTLKKVINAPQEVIDFAEARCNEYTPHDVFVMDICLCGDELFILECGCVNSAGFYAADVHKIVLDITEYFLKKTMFKKLTDAELKAIDEFGKKQTIILSGLFDNFDINDLKK